VHLAVRQPGAPALPGGPLALSKVSSTVTRSYLIASVK